jgi:Protein kinase domain.
MYVPWVPDEMEITLRCYAFEEHFKAEKTLREKHNISSEYVESLISYHNDSNYVNISFSTGKMLCISFERNDGTLGELLISNANIRSEAGWLLSCQSMLNDMARSLSHLHENGLVHGCLDTNTFAKFGDKWKMLEVGKSTAMGSAMGGYVHKYVPPESLSGVTANTHTAALSSQKRTSSRSNTRVGRKSTSSIKGGLGNLPPLHNLKDKSEKKKYGVFSFGLKDLGLGNFGAKKGKGKSDSSLLSGNSMDSSIASMKKSESNVTDEVSARVIAMQEDEIARLRKALEEKELIYRRQLAEERATYKRLEVERQREIQNKVATKKSKTSLPRYAPEKLMASALWDLWSYGTIMAEIMIGKSPLLPCSADKDEEFLMKLSKFDDVQLAAICEEVKEVAGPLAADLVGRLLNPKPQQRISSIDKVLQHRYFHEEVIEPKKINGRGRASKVTVTVSKYATNKRNRRSLSRKKH